MTRCKSWTAILALLILATALTTALVAPAAAAETYAVALVIGGLGTSDAFVAVVPSALYFKFPSPYGNGTGYPDMDVHNNGFLSFGNASASTGALSPSSPYNVPWSMMCRTTAVAADRCASSSGGALPYDHDIIAVMWEDLAMTLVRPVASRLDFDSEL